LLRPGQSEKMGATPTAQVQGSIAFPQTQAVPRSRHVGTAGACFAIAVSHPAERGDKHLPRERTTVETS